MLGTEATTAQDAQDLLAKETALSDEDPMPHADAFDIMVRLSQAIPSSMKHDVEELDVQKAHVTVRGIVGTVSDAQTIASTLAEDKCLADVKIKSATQVVGLRSAEVRHGDGAALPRGRQDTSQEEG